MSEQQQSGQDNSLDFLLIIGILVGGVYFGWYFGKTYVVSAVFCLYFYESLSFYF